MRLRWPVGLLVSAPLLVLACADREASSPASAAPSGPEVVVTPNELDAFDPDPCAHVAGPPASAESVEVGLGRAHTTARFFGPALGNRRIDDALSHALDGDDPASVARIEAYAGEIGACAVPLVPAVAHGEEARWAGQTPIVGPWSKPVTVPDKTGRIALDLRGLSDEPGLDAAIEAMVRAYVRGDLVRPGGVSRVCRGLPDEVWSVLSGDPSVYDCIPEIREDEGIASLGSAAGVFVLTSARMPPAAARWAIALRLSGIGSIVGEHVAGATAELHTTAVGARGIATRVERASIAGVALPDLVEADFRTADPEGFVAKFAGDVVSAHAIRPSTRGDLGYWQPLADRPAPHPARLGSARASIVAGFGAIERFFPMFDEVGAYPTEIVPGLVASVAQASDPRTGAIASLYQLLLPLQDGHAWPFSIASGETSESGGPAVAVLGVGEQLIVARSASPEILPGDELLLVDGASAFDRFSVIQGRVSGSVAHRRAMAASYTIGAETQAVTVRTGEGAPRTVALTPSNTAVSAVAMHNRAPGTLADLGAPELFYVSLDDGAIGKTKLEMIAEQMTQAEGVVLDMRGYPGATSYRLLSLAIPGDAKGPALFTYETRAQGATPTEPRQQRLRDLVAPKQAQVFTGKVVLLIGPDSQSSAEHLSTFFRTSARGPIIGGSTSGANGNITGLQVPGGLAFTFTGMHVKNPDGSRFHGVGLLPDIEIAPTRASLTTGTDVVLQRAIEELRKVD